MGRQETGHFSWFQVLSRWLGHGLSDMQNPAKFMIGIVFNDDFLTLALNVMDTLSEATEEHVSHHSRPHTMWLSAVVIDEANTVNFADLLRDYVQRNMLKFDVRFTTVTQLPGVDGFNFFLVGDADFGPVRDIQHALHEFLVQNRCLVDPQYLPENWCPLTPLFVEVSHPESDAVANAADAVHFPIHGLAQSLLLLKWKLPRREVMEVSLLANI